MATSRWDDVPSEEDMPPLESAEMEDDGMRTELQRLTIEDEENTYQGPLEEPEPVDPAQLQDLLEKLGESHRVTGDHLTNLAALVPSMTPRQTGLVAGGVLDRLERYPGLVDVIDTYPKEEIGLVLASGIRKLQELQVVKGHRRKEDLHSYGSLAKRFQVKKTVLQTCCVAGKLKSQVGQQASSPEQKGRRRNRGRGVPAELRNTGAE